MSIRSMLDEYLEQEYQAYVSEVRASYLHAQAEGTAIRLRVAKQKQREALALKESMTAGAGQ